MGEFPQEITAGIWKCNEKKHTLAAGALKLEPVALRRGSRHQRVLFVL